MAAATVQARALGALGTRALCWQAPAGRRAVEIAGALVEGTILADYRFDLHKSTAPDTEAGGRTGGPKHLERLIVSAPGATGPGAAGETGVGGGDGELETVVRDAALVAQAANAARDLQNRPANDLTPTALAEYALASGRGDRGAVGGGRGTRARSPRAAWARSPRSRRAQSRSRR